MASESELRESIQSNLLAYFDLADVIHFFDRFFQYQFFGIDPDIWVDMWPKLFGQFGHVA